MTDKQRLALLREAREHLTRTQQGHVQWVAAGKPRTHWRQAEAALARLEADLSGPGVPNLGPVVLGGTKLLSLVLTHNTDGIPHYPAIDLGWKVGRDVLAVEDMVVTRPSSANIGDAFYASGSSTIEYWYGHLIVAPAVGRRFRRGEKVGDIAQHPNGPHVHFAMDARPLIGHDLVYGYGPGIPTVGAQLAKALA